MREERPYCAEFLKSLVLAQKLNYFYWDFGHRDKFTKEYTEINELCDGVFGGLFVLRNSFPRYDFFYNECIEWTKRYAKCLRLPEEAVISMLLDEHHIKWHSLKSEIYCVNPRTEKITQKAKILHPHGPAEILEWLA